MMPEWSDMKRLKLWWASWEDEPCLRPTVVDRIVDWLACHVLRCHWATKWHRTHWWKLWPRWHYGVAGCISELVIGRYSFAWYQPRGERAC